jgi:hypothetical protein
MACRTLKARNETNQTSMTLNYYDLENNENESVATRPSL